MTKKTKMTDENIKNEQLEPEVVDEEINEIELLQQENENLKKEIDKEKNNYLKAHAEMENIKKRLTQDFEKKVKYRIQDFAGSLLPALDNMERAMHEVNDTEHNAMVAGLEMVYRQLLASLAEEGVTEIDALNQEFDPNIHHALMSEEVDGVKPDIVVEVLQKGYMLKDRVLRASMVKVSK